MISNIQVYHCLILCRMETERWRRMSIKIVPMRPGEEDDNNDSEFCFNKLIGAVAASYVINRQVDTKDINAAKVDEGKK